jgi:hypothetical protein
VNERRGHRSVGKADIRTLRKHGPIDHQSIEIIGGLNQKERLNFLSQLEVTSISKVKAEGESFAPLRSRNSKFSIEKKSPVCTENVIRVDDVTESLKLAE